MPDIVDYEGPLGPLQDVLARRRIAVARDGSGRVCLVRPDSVVLEFDGDDAYGAAREAIERRRLDVLGTPPHTPVPIAPPTSGAIAARLYPRIEPPAPRWPTVRVQELLEELRSDTYAVRPNQVYLADGVLRHFGIVGDRGSIGVPELESALPPPEISSARPAPAPSRLRAPFDLPGRRPPNVLVLDTGLRTADGSVEHPELRNCALHEPWLTRDDTRWNDEDEFDDDVSGRLDHQAGHGTFISGIIGQICPDAVVHTSGALTSFGDGDDASVINAVERAIGRLGDAIDIVVMSFGTYGTDDRPPPMAATIRRLLARSIVVASAGNDRTSRPYFPAALDGVIGVGALHHGRRAAFSNFGPWVDACAPAVDVVSTFFTEFDDRVDEEHGVVNQYRGWAAWSGTSFAAPKVAASIAREMYLHGGSATEAWQRLSGPARFRHPDLGVVFDVV